MVKATEKRIYLTRHAQAEHKYVFPSLSSMYADVILQCGGGLLQSVPPSLSNDEGELMNNIFSSRCAADRAWTGAGRKAARRYEGHDPADCRDSGDQRTPPHAVYDDQWLRDTARTPGGRGERSHSASTAARSGLKSVQF